MLIIWEFYLYIFMKKYYFVHRLAILSFSKLEFKLSVHVTDALNQLHIIHT